MNQPTWSVAFFSSKNKDGSLPVSLDPRYLNRAIKREHYVIPTFEDVSAKLCGKRVYIVV